MKPDQKKPPADDRILLAHGSGGAMSHDLIASLFIKAFQNPVLDRLDDMAVLEIGGAKLAFTTDSYVVTPIFFPGGDIGKLAVCGTINDLSMSGARPLYLSAGFILEEGFPLRDLEAIIASMQKTAAQAGVQIVTGDTKVVNRGGADGIFINTAGLGRIPEGVDISGRNARAGDKVLVSGSIGDHGIAILSSRAGLEFSTRLESDCAPLNDLVARMLEVSRDIHCLQRPDPRRALDHPERTGPPIASGHLDRGKPDPDQRGSPGGLRASWDWTPLSSPTKES